MKKTKSDSNLNQGNLGEFKRINELVSLQKSSECLWFSVDFRWDRSWIIHWNSFNIRGEIWRRSLMLIIISWIFSFMEQMNSFCRVNKWTRKSQNVAISNKFFLNEVLYMYMCIHVFYVAENLYRLVCVFCSLCVSFCVLFNPEFFVIFIAF